MSQTQQKPFRPQPTKCKCGAEIKAYWNLLDEVWEMPDLCLNCQQQQKQVIAEEDLLVQSNLGKRFKSKNFDNFKVNKNNKEAYEISMRFVNSFKNRLEDGRGIIFTGNYGTGKTHLAAAILQEIIKQNHTSFFISLPGLITKIKEAWDGNGSESDLINTLTGADLVVFDDLGAENTKSWIRERLFVIINSRYDQMLPTIFTTNCNISELSNKLGGRIQSRVYEMCRGVELVGEDYRKSNLLNKDK